MVADDFEESNDLLWRGRSRFPSETCMSSNVPASSQDLTLQQQKLAYPTEFSLPMFESDELQRSVEESPLFSDNR